jgi:hypothetical protein
MDIPIMPSAPFAGRARHTHRADPDKLVLEDVRRHFDTGPNWSSTLLRPLAGNPCHGPLLANMCTTRHSGRLLQIMSARV